MRGYFDIADLLFPNDQVSTKRGQLHAESFGGGNVEAGLLSEDVHPLSREFWSNYPQTYSLVGIINAATRLSRRWEDLV